MFLGFDTDSKRECREHLSLSLFSSPPLTLYSLFLHRCYKLEIAGFNNWESLLQNEVYLHRGKFRQDVHKAVTSTGSQTIYRVQSNLNLILSKRWNINSYRWTRIIFQACCCSVAQSCLTLCDPMHCSIPGFTVH